MKLLKKSAIWIVFVIYVVLAFGFVKHRYKAQKCTEVNVVITDSLTMAFINRNEVLHTLKIKGIKTLGAPLKEIRLSAIEEAVSENQIIGTCRAFTEIDGRLTIEVGQRYPMVRIMEESGKSYYLDKEGNVLNLSNRFSPHIMVVSGHLLTGIQVGAPVNILQDKKNPEYEKLREIHKLANFIEDHPLWKAQIVQVYLNADGEYELIPRIGPHLIILGGIDNYEEKFANLEVLYTEGLSHEGWNKYREINLKYKGQIVCTKI